MVKWYLWIKTAKRDQESVCHCTVFAFSSPFCREDFFSRGRDLSGIMKRKGTDFPASRGLSRRDKNERMERPLPRSDAFFHVAADQICGQN